MGQKPPKGFVWAQVFPESISMASATNPATRTMPYVHTNLEAKKKGGIEGWRGDLIWNHTYLIVLSKPS